MSISIKTFPVNDGTIIMLRGALSPEQIICAYTVDTGGNENYWFTSVQQIYSYGHRCSRPSVTD